MTCELSQLHTRGAFQPIKRSQISSVDRHKVLESHMFLHQKRNLDIKARLVAGGDKQKGILSKEDVGSPTAETESIMITSAIDAHQRREVATVDIPNAFIQTKVDERIIVCLRGLVADLLVSKFPSQYKKYAYKTKTVSYTHLTLPTILRV